MRPTWLLALLLPSAPLLAQTPTLLPGWPVTVAGTSVGGGALVDLDGDPGLEFVLVAGNSTGSQVHAFDTDGTSLPGWPRPIGSGSFSAPAFGDIDGDGDGEVVLTGFFFGISGSLYAFHHDGTPVAGFPTTAGGTLKNPALGDLDGDGDLEILVAYNSGGIAELHALQGDGSLLPGWPRVLDSVQGSSPTVGDADGDGQAEVYIPSIEFVHGFAADGSPLPGFPFDLGTQQTSYSTITLADLDRDGDRELIFGSSDFFVDLPGRIWALQHDGSALSGWPQVTQTSVYAPPSVADIDKDGFLDVAVGDQLLSPFPVNTLYAWDRFGQALPGFPIAGLDAFHQQITVADVDADGFVELLHETNVNGDDYYARNHDGTPVAGWPLAVNGSSFNQQLSVGDANLDGLLDIAGSSYRTDLDLTTVHLWTTSSPWVPFLAPVPTHMGDVSRDGHLGKETAPLLLPLGCDQNPTDSLLPLGGLPLVGTTFQLGVDNPLGTQPPGSFALLALSQTPLASPCGLSVPGLGMEGPYGVGELVLGAGFLLPFPPLPWSGAGQPTAFDVAVPLDYGLVGAEVHFQGVMLDPAQGFALTRGLTAVVGS